MPESKIKPPADPFRAVAVSLRPSDLDKLDYLCARDPLLAHMAARGRRSAWLRRQIGEEFTGLRLEEEAAKS